MRNNFLCLLFVVFAWFLGLVAGYDIGHRAGIKDTITTLTAALEKETNSK